MYPSLERQRRAPACRASLPARATGPVSPVSPAFGDAAVLVHPRKGCVACPPGRIALVESLRGLRRSPRSLRLLFKFRGPKHRLLREEGTCALGPDFLHRLSPALPHRGRRGLPSRWTNAIQALLASIV